MHLSAERATANIVAQRRGKSIILLVHAMQMEQAGQHSTFPPMAFG